MKFLKKNKAVIVTLFFSIVLIFSSYLLRSIKSTRNSEPEFISESTLIEAINISELSTAKYKYKGVVEYKNEKKKKIKCYVYYEAKVKAGIDMKQVEFDIDHENKVVIPSIPKIKITVKEIDENTIDFMLKKDEVDIKEILLECKADATKEAKRSTKLLNTAEENIQYTIEALTYPLLKQNGYRIEWADKTGEK